MLKLLTNIKCIERHTLTNGLAKKRLGESLDFKLSFWFSHLDHIPMINMVMLAPVLKLHIIPKFICTPAGVLNITSFLQRVKLMRIKSYEK